MDYITINQWLSLKKDTRKKLQEIFFIPSTGMTEVVTDEYGVSHIKSDGHTNVDLQSITAEKLVDYLGTAAINETIYDLWRRAVEKAEMPTQQQIEKTVDVLKSLEPMSVGTVIATDHFLDEVSKMNTADDQLKCDKCPFVSGSGRGLKIHKSKHNRIKVA